MKHRTGLITIVSLIVALLLAACGGSSTGNSNSSSTPTSASTSTAAPANTTVQANATLMHVPTGMATLNWNPSSKTLTVKVTLTGLAPKSIHPEHIHSGSCTNQGKVLYPLTTLMADASGTASASTPIPNVTSGIPASGWYVNVHNGPGLTTSDQFLPIVCGNVTNANTSTSAAQAVQVMLKGAPAASAGQAAMGTAQLTLNGSTLTVKVTVSGLAPKSEHANHIHLGSCTLQGKVLYPLTKLVADASGTATAMTTINGVSSIPSSGWYVNVHNSTALTTQTGFDPIACGSVIVG
ncbi:MAG: hypothetical protein NVS4B7_01480 [Ktedonobacteraceae bacterium]